MVSKTNSSLPLAAQTDSIVHFLRKKDYVVLDRDFDHGSFGTAILIQDPELDLLFVAKKYEPRSDIDALQFFEAFKRETKLLYKLNHPNIVRVFSSFLYEQMHTGYIIMEFVKGLHLDEFIENEKVKIEDIEMVFRQLIDGFHHIESNGIVHRDIRPSNIIVSSSNLAKIIDFGFGKNYSNETKTNSVREIINRESVSQLPEEEILGTYSSQTDLYYLGELFYRLLTQNHRLDAFRYRHIIDKMKEPLRCNRFASFEEVQHAIATQIQDMELYNISTDNKAIYQQFTSELCDHIVEFKEKPVFCYNADEVIQRLDRTLELNAFETTIQEPSDVLFAFFNVGYKYKRDMTLSVKSVKAFRNYLASSRPEMQRLILRNLEAKLSTISIAQSLDDLPF